MEIDIAMFTSWSFYSYGAFAKFDQTAVTAEPKEEITLTMAGVSTSGVTNGEESADVPMAGEKVYCVTDLSEMVYDNLWDEVEPENLPLKGTTDEEGKITVSFENTGTYYLYSGDTYQTFYDESDGETPCVAPPYCVVTVKNTYPVELKGLHDAQINTMKLYTYKDGTKGDTNLLEGISAVADGTYNRKYTTALEAGDYWVEGYDASGNLNGGLVITVKADKNVASNTFTIYRVYQMYATNSGWVNNTDYTINVKVTGQDGTDRKSSVGTATYLGKTNASCLFMAGDTVEATFTPIGEKAETAKESVVTKNKNQTTTNINISTKIPQVYLVTVKAPAGSTIDAGTFSSYYVYDFVEPTVTTDDTGVTAVFRMPEISSGSQGPYHFLRVQNPKGVTYWSFDNWKENKEIMVTEEDLYMNSTEFTKDTVYRYDKNVYDRADIYLNINNKGYMDMELGETYELNVFRNWMAIESFYNAKVALPDMTYTVIDMDGNESDVVTITKDKKNSSVATMTANKAGTAIVLVTYDAMTHMQGQSSTDSKQFSAIWPECTGVFVVSVGAGENSIETNMTMERIGAAEGSTETIIDAEHDILFYIDKEGASYTFTPEEGCTVTVNRSVVDDSSMDFKGFTADKVTVNETTGAVTVSGLTTGRHIIKVEKGGKATYQVITARQISYVIKDSEGNELAEGAEIKAGDTIQIQFNNLVNPAEKMSGAYNFNAAISYLAEDGTSFKSNPGGAYGVYDFSGNPERQLISITIPKYWTGTTYHLDGAIVMNGYANVAIGGHRGVTYKAGLNPGYNSPKVGSILSQMPEITLDIAKTDFLTGTLKFEDEEGNDISLKNLTITLTDEDGNDITIKEDGTFQCVEENYSYIVKGAGVAYKTGEVTVAKDSKNEFTVTLQTTGTTAWDGMTTAEPKKGEDGVYLISNGAELAWFSAKNNSGTAVSGKLTADIDLAQYPWNNTVTSSSVATVLDGAGHEIKNLNAARGLFGALGNGSQITNLTIRGSVKGTTVNVGGIAGYINGSNIVIKNCANFADVTSTNQYAGGIVGGVNGTATISGCYNAGKITGTTYVGGIYGSAAPSYITANITIENCYNKGAISGTGIIGGIGGKLAGGYTSGWFGGGNTVTVSMKDCYNSAAVTSSGTAGGVVGECADNEYTSTEHCYYLKGTAAADTIAEELTEEEMKDADLNQEAFGGVCYGYPALKWQKDVTFHTYCECTGKNETCKNCVYTAPTTTKEGSIVRTCLTEGCGATKTDTIPVIDKSEADQNAADAVIAKIEAIGTVTLKSESKITAARKAYNALTADQKKLVTNYKTLTTAESKLKQLKTAEEKVAADKKKASEVVTKIKAIGTVTLKSESKIKAARKAYNALTADQKKYVSSTYKKKLTTAESTLEKYQAAVKKGKKVTVGTNIYKITRASLKSGTVEFVKPEKTTQKSVKVPDTVKIYGVTYKVTSIGNKAFQKNKKLTSVSIGKNVTSIGNYAFDNCSKLTKLTLPSNVKTVGSYAFQNCKKLKTLTIQSKKMTSKTISKKAFDGVTKTTTIKVDSSKKKEYTTLFRKCGLSTKVKIKVK